jgi:hypothetical protein
MSNDLAKAHSLIKECLETKKPYLDLSNCGIDDLDMLPELFECTYLETLILSDTLLEINSNESKLSNRGKLNTFDRIPSKIEGLKNLKKLCISGRQQGELCGDSVERDHSNPAQADHLFRVILTMAFRGKLTTANV